MDLSLFLNKLLFWCTAKPGLAKVLMTIVNFESTAIRCVHGRVVREYVKGVGKSVCECVGYAHAWFSPVTDFPSLPVLLGPRAHRASPRTS